MPYRLRPAREADIEEIAALENACFTDPWAKGELLSAIRQAGEPEGANRTAAFFTAAERDGRIVGYCAADRVLDEGQILSLAVLPDCRRAGIGRALLRHTLALLDVPSVWLEVRASNAAARGLYRSEGFEELARRAAYYRRPVEDAVVMRNTARYTAADSAITEKK